MLQQLDFVSVTKLALLPVPVAGLPVLTFSTCLVLHTINIFAFTHVLAVMFRLLFLSVTLPDCPVLTPQLGFLLPDLISNFDLTNASISCVPVKSSGLFFQDLSKGPQLYPDLIPRTSHLKDKFFFFYFAAEQGTRNTYII